MIRFSVNAWAKLNYMRDLGDTEIGGFGILDADNPLIVHDFQTVKQECSQADVDLDPDAVNDWVCAMCDKGYQPWQCTRMWIHTHPKMSANPSAVDLEQFAELILDRDFMIFFILSKTDDTWARVEYARPRINVSIKHVVDFSLPYTSSDHSAWKKEYEDNVTESHAWGHWQDNRINPYTHVGVQQFQNQAYLDAPKKKRHKPYKTSRLR